MTLRVTLGLFLAFVCCDAINGQPITSSGFDRTNKAIAEIEKLASLTSQIKEGKKKNKEKSNTIEGQKATRDTKEIDAEKLVNAIEETEGFIAQAEADLKETQTLIESLEQEINTENTRITKAKNRLNDIPGEKQAFLSNANSKISQHNKERASWMNQFHVLARKRFTISFYEHANYDRRMAHTVSFAADTSWKIFNWNDLHSHGYRVRTRFGPFVIRTRYVSGRNMISSFQATRSLFLSPGPLLLKKLR